MKREILGWILVGWPFAVLFLYIFWEDLEAVLLILFGSIAALLSAWYGLVLLGVGQ